MHPTSHRSHRFGMALIASGLLLAALAGGALAQLPAPTCDITSEPVTIGPGQPFTLCGPAGEGFTYSWYDASDVLLTHDRCYNSPGLPPGTYDYVFVISQGLDFKKCPYTVVIRENPPPPPPGKCWLTGGGAKFIDQATSQWHSFGGNVNPGCSPTAGDGGNWNDIDHTHNLHFQGRAIEVLRCGNMEGIPEGSTSPVTPFNYIEFRGVGTLTGIRGNKADYGTVYFWAHYEDRGEPGSSGEPSPNGRDRYFLHVFGNPADPAGSTLLLVDLDGDPTTVDPVTITHGNLQLHISSCDTPPPVAMSASNLDEDVTAESGAEVPSELSFAAASPNPALGRTLLRFGLPRDAGVSLKVFDVAGRVVRELASGRVTSGQHSVAWDLRDSSGQRVSRGLYFLRLAVDGVVRTQHVTVLN